MLELIVLGSASAVPDLDHENAHLVLVGETRTVMIDCAGTPLVRLPQAGVDPNTITDPCTRIIPEISRGLLHVRPSSSLCTSYCVHSRPS